MLALGMLPPRLGGGALGVLLPPAYGLLPLFTFPINDMTLQYLPRVTSVVQRVAAL